jgi:hypothetical protein
MWWPIFPKLKHPFVATTGRLQQTPPCGAELVICSALVGRADVVSDPAKTLMAKSVTVSNTKLPFDRAKGS